MTDPLINNPVDLLVPEQDKTEEEEKNGYPCHPFAIAFHLLWKIAAILTYLLGGLLTSLINANSMAAIIFCIVFLAFDFWTTKNVSGRLLAGLRWWNQVKPDGSNNWLFESHEDRTLINPIESKIFWIPVLLSPIIWFIFAIKNLFSFPNWEWLPVCLLALILQCSNSIGYIKCARSMYAFKF